MVSRQCVYILALVVLKFVQNLSIEVGAVMPRGESGSILQQILDQDRPHPEASDRVEDQ